MSTLIAARKRAKRIAGHRAGLRAPVAVETVSLMAGVRSGRPWGAWRIVGARYNNRRAATLGAQAAKNIMPLGCPRQQAIVIPRAALKVLTSDRVTFGTLLQNLRRASAQQHRTNKQSNPHFILPILGGLYPYRARSVSGTKRDISHMVKG